ncbi:LLM class flavin-dependent oxidoreductase [Kineococcus aurantiacus]|uniref:Alkanesulfonate monooxygenase SsuD/methylene tetrahydromethanopterin reductase-like flavin-dependent oxidoreductase (Luciferase family) n=1 Tax=Kineococcus aurantiacus TaxID=37633 RepID=A0A7Y9DP71_9ACTN|nr:LLM class flavin-dependent oxidoreductase [Kineococcus aurantiacus]NYD24199.1 alkanesulfonate monooxygenase SsuD/methylene tetrahydromethanopterin reductase-like flavin-dependent oxidoreductase (luciferase family) [Kineococcus aurantiacus]
MGRLQHFGYFFSRGFGPQGWGRDYQAWNDDWTRPDLYAHAVRDLERAGFDLVVVEDAISLGNPQTLDLRVRAAYGGPKHDPLLLAPYLFAATTHLGVVPTVNAGITPPYLAARQAATLQHLSGSRFGINLVTDTGSARHVGLDPVPHDVAYDRAEEWIDVVRRLWHSWDPEALVADPVTGRFADGTRIDAFAHRGEHFRLDGPLNALPFSSGDPVLVSPGGSPRGLGFAGSRSDVQLALAPLRVDRVREYRRRVLDAAALAGRKASDVRVLLVVKPELVASAAEADRVVEASAHPGEDVLREVALHWSSDLETDLTALPLDRPLDPAVFGDHVSLGTISALRGDTPDAPLRELLTRKARKGRLADRSGLVGTAEEFADLVEEFGEDAGNDGFLLSGDLHPVTLHRFLDDLVPVLRRRGVLRSGYGGGGLRGNLFEF